MYTKEFKLLMERFGEAEAAFDANPCGKTAKPLSDLRVQIANAPDASKYTQEYLASRRNKWSNLLCTLDIAVRLDRCEITEAEASSMFQTADAKFPIDDK
jgi:hypothetical protein